MANYKHVKYCRLCKTRFVVEKSLAKMIYCEGCQKRLAKAKEEKR